MVRAGKKGPNEARRAFMDPAPHPRVLWGVSMDPAPHPRVRWGVSMDPAPHPRVLWGVSMDPAPHPRVLWGVSMDPAPHPRVLWGVSMEEQRRRDRQKVHDDAARRREEERERMRGLRAEVYAERARRAPQLPRPCRGRADDEAEIAALKSALAARQWRRRGARGAAADKASGRWKERQARRARRDELRASQGSDDDGGCGDLWRPRGRRRPPPRPALADPPAMIPMAGGLFDGELASLDAMLAGTAARALALKERADRFGARVRREQEA
eukprot:gene18635-33298_t